MTKSKDAIYYKSAKHFKGSDLALLIVQKQKPKKKKNKIFIHKDKKRYPHNFYFLFLLENINCGYSLEVPQWGTSNEYPQFMFSQRNKKYICTFLLKKKYIIWGYDIISPL